MTWASPNGSEKYFSNGNFDEEVFMAHSDLNKLA